MNDLGEISQFLGIEVHKDHWHVCGLLQIIVSGFVKQALERVFIIDAEPRNPSGY